MFKHRKANHQSPQAKQPKPDVFAQEQIYGKGNQPKTYSPTHQNFSWALISTFLCPMFRDLYLSSGHPTILHNNNQG